MATVEYKSKMLQHIIETIKAEMEAQGINAPELHKRCKGEIGLAYIYDVLKGNYSPTVEKLEPIMKALNLRLEVCQHDSRGALTSDK